MQTWTINDPDTWKGCSYQGRHWFIGGTVTPSRYYATAKWMLMNELEVRKHVEACSRGEEPVSGHAIEHALIGLSRVVRGRDPMRYRGWANMIEGALDESARQFVYGLLQGFLLNRPRQSIWIQAYNATMNRARPKD